MTTVGLCVTLLVAALGSDPAIDLTHAQVVGRGAKAPIAEQTAVACLVEEVAKRSRIKWPQSDTWPKDGPVIAVLSRSDDEWTSKLPVGWLPKVRALPPEGYAIVTDTQTAVRPTIWIVGADPRGTLFGVGHFLRQLELRDKTARLPQRLELTSAPAYPLRGHQLGYRARANSYDAWNIPQFEQYIRELALLGANCMENIPFQDDSPSPHMRVPRARMNVALSEICQRYDLEYWLWTPAEFDLNDKPLRQQALAQHAALFRACPRLDGVFFPGGDPGDNPAQPVLAYLEELAGPLCDAHPTARLWLSLQGFDEKQVDLVYQYLDEKKPAWLGGLVAGPSSPPIPETRRRLPASYALRHYPDITHTVRCQYPVPWWDQAFDLTLGRECPNPEPLYSALLHNWFAPYTVGFLSYSDGIHDDVNKIVWTRLAWDPKADVRDILIDYCRLFFGADVATKAADGLLALERNWQGALADNGGVEATLAQWQTLDGAAPGLRDNWRWQLCLLRANYDAYVRQRLLSETKLEDQANAILADASALGAEKAIGAALAVLERADQPPAPELRGRIDELCAALFKSIGLQTSVKRYGASGAERGCVLDFVDHPLNNRWWLEDEFARIRRLASEADKVAALRAIAAWEHPGPGSFYDAVAHVAKSPHVVRGEGLGTDPTMSRNPNPDFMWWDNGRSRKRLSWMSFMNWPLALAYEGLDPQANYVVRLTGYRQSLLRINGQRVQPTIDGRGIGEFKEFPVPRELLAEGKLRLTWDRPDDEAQLNWRDQSRLTEVWLLKQ